MMFYHCPFCKERIVLYWQNISIWRCYHCGLLFRNPQFNDARIVELYDASWKNPMAHRDETGGTTARLAEIYLHNLLKALRIKDIQGLSILEFGAGKGIMSETLKNAGAYVWAVEPFGFKACRKKEISTVCTLDEIHGEIKFDGIICINVLEHLRCPWEELRRFHALLKPCGWLYLATPNAGGLNAQILKGKWREALKKSHLFFFKPLALENLLENTGFYSWQRLRWFVRYSINPIRQILHSLLQLAFLDGELRYIAIKK